MARVSMPSRVSMTTPVWPRVQSCVRSVAGVIVAKAGISGCNFADRTNGGRLTLDDQAYSRDGLRGVVSSCQHAAANWVVARPARAGSRRDALQ